MKIGEHKHWSKLWCLSILLLSPLAFALHPCAPLVLSNHATILEELQSQAQVLKTISEQGISEGPSILPPENLRIWKRLAIPDELDGDQEVMESIGTAVRQRDHYLALAAEKILERDICEERLGKYLKKLKKPAWNISAQGLARLGREVMETLASLSTPAKPALVPILNREESTIVEFYLDQLWQKVWANHFMALTQQALAPRLYLGPLGAQYLWEISFTPTAGRKLFDLATPPTSGEKPDPFWPLRDRYALETFLNQQQTILLANQANITFIVGHLNHNLNGLETLNPQQLGLRHHLSSEIFIGANEKDDFLPYYVLRENQILSNTANLLYPVPNYVGTPQAIFWNNHKNGVTYYDYGRWSGHQHALEQLIAPKPHKVLALQALREKLGEHFEDDRVAIFKSIIRPCYTAWQQGTAKVKVLAIDPTNMQLANEEEISLHKVVLPPAPPPAPKVSRLRRPLAPPAPRLAPASPVVLDHQPILHMSLIFVEITTPTDDGVLMPFYLADPQQDLTKLINQRLFEMAR